MLRRIDAKHTRFTRPPLLRNLKIQAAQSGKSLNTLLNELIVRAMAMPVAPAAEATLPVLSRLNDANFEWWQWLKRHLILTMR